MENSGGDSNLYRTFLIKRNAVCVLKNFTIDWQPMQWNLAILSQYLSGQNASVKVGAPYSGDLVPKESDCTLEQWDLGELCTFLKSYSNDKQFYYAGYAHIMTFNTINKSFLSFDWSWAGLSSTDANKSTLWIGSKGSFTPCHKDSYGCNLHAQIIGRKEWLLWPPNCDLGATRVPYEESSTFTNVDVLQKPWIDMAVRIVVQPGQVLFIPKHWWHLARNQETSVSINTWIELECDAVDRLRESVTRLLVCTVKSKEQDEDWVNPGEDLSTYSENVSYLKQSLSLLKEKAAPAGKPNTINYYTAEKKAGVGIKFQSLSVPQCSSIATKPKVPENIVDTLLNSIVADDVVLDRIVAKLLESS